MTKAKTTPPWEQENPKPDGEHEKLTKAEKAKAKKSAAEAGRPYPNLVDNMRVAHQKGKSHKSQS
jgi:hypothetical protein